ncbi:uncharacterized protein si:ch211-139g16.8 [Colossoma macropomum]|uniref:uncharacterized protein si:ch211-139g16.8 n=1 Tax=Colossoma macropomum TaxID=42526 RepID=UPI0018652C7B|nr:uncharacterized protein si:ch211-139g16.8 [Colossoma macropomum]
MVLYLFFQITFILIFTSALTVNGCQIDVRQPQELLTGSHSKNESVFVQCHINISACPSSRQEVLWYVFTSDSHHQLDTKSQPSKYQLDSQGLQIKSLTTSDDGVYYCAVILNDQASKGAQAFGNGTRLTVKEHVYHPGKAVLLVLLVLLTLYSLTILTLIICTKTGQRTLSLKGRIKRSDRKSDLSRQVHFGAVVQELYSKRNLRSNKKNSTEVSQENKCENPRTNGNKEDIYQNLNKTG